ncbi:HDOD domain-containing protein [Ditylenchus destructor]|nr:HDOD domain-containing protein [Ditylenchus destructor]
MRLANSPRYRPEREITDLSGAVFLLGQQGLNQLVMSVALRPIFNQAKGRYGSPRRHLALGPERARRRRDHQAGQCRGRRVLRLPRGPELAARSDGAAAGAGRDVGTDDPAAGSGGAASAAAAADGRLVRADRRALGLPVQGRRGAGAAARTRGGVGGARAVGASGPGRGLASADAAGLAAGATGRLVRRAAAVLRRAGARVQRG